MVLGQQKGCLAVSCSCFTTAVSGLPWPEQILDVPSDPLVGVIEAQSTLIRDAYEALRVEQWRGRMPSSLWADD